MEKGSSLKDDKIVIDEEAVKSDEEKSDSKVTIGIIQELAMTINPMIRLTIETPCSFTNGKMPILDIQVDINLNQMNRIDFEFYQKPTKNQRVILADSALSFSKKRTILTQECLRRLRNTKVELGQEVQRKHLNIFMLELKSSGYRKNFRKEVLDSAYKAFYDMLEKDKTGIKP